MIENIGTKKGWNYPSYGSEKYQKGVTRQNGQFVCEACNKVVDYPVFRNPSVYTPSKPIVENKKRRARLEDFDADEVSGSVKDLDKCNTDGALDKKKKRKYIVEESETE
nr:nucleic acid-binding, OB-fold protein [Tanacetum cinerariifolium]